MASIAPTEGSDQQQPRRVYLLTSPRTASNLFVKILNIEGQPKAKCPPFYGGYFFMPAFRVQFGLNKWHLSIQDYSDEDKEQIRAAYQNGLDEYVEFLKTTQAEGKIAFVKEHITLMLRPTLLNEFIHGIPQTSIPEPWSLSVGSNADLYTPANPTIVPDSILQTFQPTFLIRHPAVQMPSFYRTYLRGKSENEPPLTEFMMRGTYQITAFRRMYDLYVHQLHPESAAPAIIDGSDFINHPAPLMKEFCKRNGFDFSCCKFNWDAMPQEVVGQLDKLSQSALSTLSASTGVMASKANETIDLGVEAAKWREEFGEEMGKVIEKFVLAAMPDYEYLFARRLNPETLEDDATNVKINPK